jgi:hypothetical protein
VDLNITVRDLRHIPVDCVDVKKSLKNFAGGACGAYSASEGAIESSVPI